MSISDAIASIGTLVTIAAVVVGTLLYIITRKPGKPSTKVLIIISAITTAIIVGIVGTAVFISVSTTITINGHKTISIPGFPAATETPTSTPSPTPTPKVVNKNLTIPCTTCYPPYKIEVVLNNILINTSNPLSVWNFTLTSTGQACSSVSFARLELEDGTGQQHEGTGRASDKWSMSSGQSISTSADFNLVLQPNVTYLLNLSISCEGSYTSVYQTEPFMF